MLTIALEPEAAALFVKYLPVERKVDGNDKEVLQAFAPGSKYIVVDAGGQYIIIAKLLTLIWNLWITTEKKSNIAWLYEIGKQWKGTYTFNLIKLAAKNASKIGGHIIYEVSANFFFFKSSFVNKNTCNAR